MPELQFNAHGASWQQTQTEPCLHALLYTRQAAHAHARFQLQLLLLDQGQSAETHAESQARFMSDDMPRLMFLLLPVFALLLKAVFPRRLYFDHLIFSVHLHSAAFVILALILPFEKIANQNLPALALQVTLMAYFIFYLVTSMRRVYSVTWPGTIGRAAAVLFGYLVVFSLLIEGTSSYLIISD